jgi:hypothetical protein
MSNIFGNQGNAQLSGSNIAGVSAGNGPQKDAQALQRAGQAAFGAAGMSAATNATLGGLSASTASFGNPSATSAAIGSPAAGSSAFGGLTASNALGGLTASNAAGLAGAGAAGQQSNAQIAGSNIVGVSAGDGPQNNAQAMQQVGQQPLG